MKRILKCSQKLFDTIILPLDNINSVSDSRPDLAFERTLHKSLELKGMIHPILVCLDKDFKQTDISKFERRPVPEEIQEKYRCLIGNNRYKFALNNGYTHIECHVVKTFDDVKRAHRKTEIEPRKM